MTRVLLCEDAVAFGVLFERWMRGGDIEVVAQATTGDEAVTLAGRHRPDVIVVDHLLRDGSSEALVPRLRQACPGARILLISGMPEDRLADIARASGADAHLPKAATVEQMRGAVRALSGSAD